MPEENLKDLINNLTNCHSEKCILDYLQKIGNYLILKCRFEIEKNNEYEVLIPLWVEAYYCSGNPNLENPLFIDEAMDASSKKWDNRENRQWNNYGDLYFSTRGGNYSRVDVVLSDSNNYALSFLIKMCLLIKNDKYEILNQSNVSRYLKDKKSRDYNIIFNDKFNNFIKALNKKRIGINPKKNYWDKNLASTFILNNERSYSYRYILKNRNNFIDMLRESFSN